METQNKRTKKIKKGQAETRQTTWRLIGEYG
jgi:hypothetical protein